MKASPCWITILEAQQRYLSYRAMPLAMLWRSSSVLVSIGIAQVLRDMCCGIAQICLCKWKCQWEGVARYGYCTDSISGCSSNPCPGCVAKRYITPMGGVFHAHGRCMSYRSVVYAGFLRNVNQSLKKFEASPVSASRRFSFSIEGTKNPTRNPARQLAPDTDFPNPSFGKALLVSGIMRLGIFDLLFICAWCRSRRFCGSWVGGKKQWPAKRAASVCTQAAGFQRVFLIGSVSFAGSIKCLWKSNFRDAHMTISVSLPPPWRRGRCIAPPGQLGNS